MSTSPIPPETPPPLESGHNGNGKLTGHAACGGEPSAELVLQLKSIAGEILEAQETVWRELGASCKALLRAAEAASLAGQKFAEARPLCSETLWQTWLQVHCHGIERSMASHYVRFARSWPQHSAPLRLAANVGELRDDEKFEVCRGLIRAVQLSLFPADQDNAGGQAATPQAAGGTETAALEVLPPPLAVKELLRWAHWIGDRAERLPAVVELTAEEKGLLKRQLQPIVEFHQRL